jgi:hypothetical protein
MKKHSNFIELFRIFRRSFVESDSLAVNADYNTNLWQILGFLATPGIFSFLLIDALTAPDSLWILRGLRTFFAAFGFTVAAGTTLFEWDMLFPDRRDFLILTQFPIHMRELFAAKIAALGALIGTLVATLNVGAVGMLVLVMLFAVRAHNLHAVRTAIGFVLGNAAAAVFGFLCVATLQAILVNLTSVRMFRRISPFVQSAGMSLMVLALVLSPVYVQVKLVRAFFPQWLRWFPPYWFAAMQESPSPKSDYLFAEIARLGIRAFGFVLLLGALAWALGFARHYRRTLEAEDSGARLIRSQSGIGSLLGTPQERGIFHFTGAILARSTTHRMFLACYASLGIGLGIVAGLTPGMDGFSFSADGKRAFPFLMIFFVISGLRSVFQFPSELNANWLFQMAEAGWGRAACRATRLRIIATVLLPALAIFAPFEIITWGFNSGLTHTAIQAVSGLLLIEIIFWTFDRVPFTCSYFPGKTNLAMLVFLYFYGFTNYSFRMADLEKWIELNPLRGAAVLVTVLIAVPLIWRWKADTEMIRFDGNEPEIQVLDLS